MHQIINLKYNKKSIKEKRLMISQLLIQSSSNIKSVDIHTISSDDLYLLFQLYDKFFLDNWLTTNYKGKIKFTLSRRLTRSAGQTKWIRNIGRIKPEQRIIEISIGVDFVLNYDQVEGKKSVGGIATGNSLEALQLVFEHELCHVIEYICFGETKCSGDRFKTIAGNLFGHTGRFHSLPTSREIATQKLGLKIGDVVFFSFKDCILQGILYRINKRATIMVKDNQGNFLDKQGNRYSKYYVPINLLYK